MFFLHLFVFIATQGIRYAYVSVYVCMCLCGHMRSDSQSSDSIQFDQFSTRANWNNSRLPRKNDAYFTIRLLHIVWFLSECALPAMERNSLDVKSSNGKDTRRKQIYIFCNACESVFVQAVHGDLWATACAHSNVIESITVRCHPFILQFNWWCGLSELLCAGYSEKKKERKQ